jgi:hypothetical protein
MTGPLISPEAGAFILFVFLPLVIGIWLVLESGGL